jgi:hypothetical protein
MSDPYATLGLSRKEGVRMHKATLTAVSPFGGEYVSVYSDENLSTLYARIVGAVQGATDFGGMVTSLIIEEV